MKRLIVGFVLLPALLMAACASLDTDVNETPVVVPVTVQAVASEPTVEPGPPPTDAPLQSQLSVEAVTYRNEEAGFEFDYPASWVPDEQVFGPRGSGVQFTPSEDIWLTVMVMLWDPKNDLDAFIDQRRMGWSSSTASVRSFNLSTNTAQTTVY